jgi:hypothetical protein
MCGILKGSGVAPGYQSPRQVRGGYLIRPASPIKATVWGFRMRSRGHRVDRLRMEGWADGL